MAARVVAIQRFLADSGQEFHEDHRSQTPDSSRRNLPLLGHRLGRDRVAGNAWKVRLLKSLSRHWAKSAITNQSRLTACVQIERPGLEGTSGTSTEVGGKHLHCRRSVPLAPSTHERVRRHRDTLSFVLMAGKRLGLGETSPYEQP